MNGVPFWYGTGKTIAISAVSSGINFGIGEAVKGINNGITKALLQAGMHGTNGGIISSIDGGNFISGFASGAVSSLISSGIESFKADKAGNLTKFGKSSYYKAMMIASGGLSGGISSSIAGEGGALKNYPVDDFSKRASLSRRRKGVRQGIITSGLNHLAHTMFTPGENLVTNSSQDDSSDETEIVNPDASQKGGAKALRILSSFIAYDKDKTFFGKALQIVSHFTWELPQQLTGVLTGQVTNALGGIESVYRYTNGAIVLNSNWINFGVGFTLGNVITVGYGNNITQQNEIIKHEFGHYIQSRRYGPLWGVIFAVPSITRAFLWNINIVGGKYSEFYTESNADKLGNKYW